MRITATGTCVDNAHIYFWAAFQAPPDTTGGQIITIERKAIGSFVPATVGNWIAIEKGVSQSPVIPDPSDGVSGTWSYFPSPDVPPGTPPAADSHVVTCGTCGNFTKTTSRSWNTFTGARVLKGEISFKLENSGNKLEFNNTTKGVKIEFRTGAGEPPICPDGCLPPE